MDEKIERKLALYVECITTRTKPSVGVKKIYELVCNNLGLVVDIARKYRELVPTSLALLIEAWTNGDLTTTLLCLRLLLALVSYNTKLQKALLENKGIHVIVSILGGIPTAGGDERLREEIVDACCSVLQTMAARKKARQQLLQADFPKAITSHISSALVYQLPYAGEEEGTLFNTEIRLLQTLLVHGGEEFQTALRQAGVLVLLCKCICQWLAEPQHEPRLIGSVLLTAAFMVANNREAYTELSKLLSLPRLAEQIRSQTTSTAASLFGLLLLLVAPDEGSGLEGFDAEESVGLQLCISAYHLFCTAYAKIKAVRYVPKEVVRWLTMVIHSLARGASSDEQQLTGNDGSEALQRVQRQLVYLATPRFYHQLLSTLFNVDEAIISTGALLLYHVLLDNELTKALFMQLGGLAVLVQLLDDYDPRIQALTLQILCILCTGDTGAECAIELVERGAADSVMKCIAQYVEHYSDASPEQTDVVEAAVNLLGCIAPTAQEYFRVKHVFDTLQKLISVRCMEQTTENRPIIDTLLTTLNNLVIHNEKNQQAIINNGTLDWAFSILVKAVAQEMPAQFLGTGEPSELLLAALTLCMSAVDNNKAAQQFFNDRGELLLSVVSTMLSSWSTLETLPREAALLGHFIGHLAWAHPQNQLLLATDAVIRQLMAIACHPIGSLEGDVETTPQFAAAVALMHLGANNSEVQHSVGSAGGIEQLLAMLETIRNRPDLYNLVAVLLNCIGVLVAHTRSANAKRLIDYNGIERIVALISDEEDDEISLRAFAVLSKLGGVAVAKLLALLDGVLSKTSHSDTPNGPQYLNQEASEHAVILVTVLNGVVYQLGPENTEVNTEGFAVLVKLFTMQACRNDIVYATSFLLVNLTVAMTPDIQYAMRASGLLDAIAAYLLRRVAAGPAASSSFHGNTDEADTQTVEERANLYAVLANSAFANALNAQRLSEVFRGTLVRHLITDADGSLRRVASNPALDSAVATLAQEATRLLSELTATDSNAAVAMSSLDNTAT